MWLTRQHGEVAGSKRDVVMFPIGLMDVRARIDLTAWLLLQAFVEAGDGSPARLQRDVVPLGETPARQGSTNE
jgi:hypothetical protein